MHWHAISEIWLPDSLLGLQAVCAGTSSTYCAFLRNEDKAKCTLHWRRLICLRGVQDAPEASMVSVWADTAGPSDSADSENLDNGEESVYIPQIH